ncbi:hypothetical protein BDR03DRAFT_972055 [Suillus americanus]|nr:hypothetical protein BDR03DRAFT_972055 [Suillus americanus]
MQGATIGSLLTLTTVIVLIVVLSIEGNGCVMTLVARAVYSSSSDLRLWRMHHMMRKPSIAKPARQPVIPPTTAAMLTEPEEPAVEGVADVMFPVPMSILVEAWK